MTTEERELVEIMRNISKWNPLDYPFVLHVRAAASLIERIAKERDEAIVARANTSREFFEYAFRMGQTKLAPPQEPTP